MVGLDYLVDSDSKTESYLSETSQNQSCALKMTSKIEKIVGVGPVVYMASDRPAIRRDGK